MSLTRPTHYTGHGVEPIDAIEDWGLGFALGNTVKYISRAGRKVGQSTESDLRKALWYLAYAIGGKVTADRAVAALTEPDGGNSPTIPDGSTGQADGPSEAEPAQLEHVRHVGEFMVHAKRQGEMGALCGAGLHCDASHWLLLSRDATVTCAACVAWMREAQP